MFIAFISPLRPLLALISSEIWFNLVTYVRSNDKGNQRNSTENPKEQYHLPFWKTFMFFIVCITCRFIDCIPVQLQT